MANTKKNLDDLEKEIDKQYRRKDQQKSRKMKVSGKSVFQMQRIINKKSKSSSH